MDLSTLAVPHTLAALSPLLPTPPARIAEIGCGRGALAAALAGQGYEVTGVDRDAEMVTATRARGVPALAADVLDVTGQTFDVLLFTRSLHHADDVDEILRHARSLLRPGGVIVIEEFAWERVDRTTAAFLYDRRRRLVRSGLLDAATPAPSDELDAWVAGHATLHQGSQMLAALGRVGTHLTCTGTSMLWRLVDGRGGTWRGEGAAVGEALEAMRIDEEQRIGSGAVTPVGLVPAVRV